MFAHVLCTQCEFEWLHWIDIWFEFIVRLHKSQVHVGPGFVSTSPARGRIVEERYFLVRRSVLIEVVPGLQKTCHLAAGAERRPSEKTAILGSSCEKQGSCCPGL